MPENPEAEEMESLKTIARGAGIVFAGLFISKILAYLYRLFIARFFGPGDYGLFSIGIAVIGLFTVLALLGLPTGVTRYVAFHNAKGEERKTRGVILSAVLMVLVSSVILSAVLMLLSGFIATGIFSEPALGPVLLVLAMSIPFTALFNLVYSVFLGFRKVEYRVYTESIFQNVSRLLLVVVFGMVSGAVLGIAWAWTAAVITTFVFSLYLLGRCCPLRSAVRPEYEIGELLRYSLPLLLVGFMGFLVLWTDTMMLGFFRDSYETGIYNAALPTSQLLLIIPSAFTMIFMPLITELHAKKRLAELKNVYRTVTKWTFFFNIPIFLLLILFSRQILNILFGPEYIPGFQAIVILSVGIMLYTSVPNVMVLQMIKKTKEVMYVTIVNATSNVALNLLLIPLDLDLGFMVIGGMNGAAIASAITYMISFSLMFLLAFKNTRINPISGKIAKSLVAAVISSFVVYIIASTTLDLFPVTVLVILFGIFVSLYAFMLLVLKGFDSNDIKIIRSIEKKVGIRIGFARRIIRRFA